MHLERLFSCKLLDKGGCLIFRGEMLLERLFACNLLDTRVVFVKRRYALPQNSRFESCRLIRKGDGSARAGSSTEMRQGGGQLCLYVLFGDFHCYCQQFVFSVNFARLGCCCAIPIVFSF